MQKLASVFCVKAIGQWITNLNFTKIKKGKKIFFFPFLLVITRLTIVFRCVIMINKKGVMEDMMKKGFTLAEVLITLGVIGVVAALTLPGIMQSYQKKVYVAQLQRVFNEVANGARSYMLKEGVDKLD